MWGSTWSNGLQKRFSVRRGLSACRQPTNIKTNIPSDHMKANTLQNIKHILLVHYTYQCSAYISAGIWTQVQIQNQTNNKKHPFPCNIHTQISPVVPHPNPLRAHFLIILLFLSSLSSRKQWITSRALHVFAVYACIYVCGFVCVYVCPKVKQPLNKFESVTHLGLPSLSISADRMACLCSMHAAHCGL